MTQPADVSARPLATGEPQQRSFDDATPHAYAVEVAANHLLRVTAEQRGVDVEVRLFAPDGRRVMVMDSPTGDQGPETVSAVAEETGTWRVEVHPFDHGPGADYEIRIEDLRPADDEDRRRVEAEQSFARGEELRRQDEYAQAEKQYHRALRAFRTLGDRAAEAHSLYRIGWCESQVGKNRDAVDHLDLAVRRFAELGDGPWQLTALARLGRAYREEGRPEEAIATLQRAVRIAPHINDPLRHATALTFLGDALRWSDRTAEALDAYRRALDLWSGLAGSQVSLAATWVRVAELYLVQNRLEEARDALERAQATDIEPTHPLRSKIYTQLGNVARRAERWDDADRSLRQALELAEEQKDDRSRALAHSALGTLLLQRGRPDTAEAHLDSALSLARRMGNRRMEAMLLHKKGRQRFQVDDMEGAADLHRQAIELFERNDDRQGLASARYALARIHHRQGEYTATRDELAATLRSADDLRSDTEIPDLQASYVDSKHHYWELYVDTLMHLEEQGWQGSADSALAVVENWRARGLVEMLEEAGVDVRQDVDDRLIAREQRAQRDLSAIEFRRLELLASDDREALAEVEQERMRALAELHHVRAEIRRSSTLFRDLHPASRQSVLYSSAISDVQQDHLDGNTLILVYALGEERSFGWTVTSDAAHPHVLPPRRDIEELAITVRELLRSGAESSADRRRAAASRLADQILVPMFEGLKAAAYRRLVIVADGALLYVPFAALPIPDGRGGRVAALAHYEVVYLPSVTTLIALRNTLKLRREGDRTAAEAAAVIADPVLAEDDPRLSAAQPADRKPAESSPSAVSRAARDTGRDGFARLPATAAEARLIRDLAVERAKGDVLLAEGFDASHDLVTSGRLSRYRTIHFATHGLLNRQHPELSGLVLSLFDRQGRPSNGFLRLHELYGLDLPAELVVLSACETGLGRRYRGEGLVGLTRGFMYAGAPRVVVSLWKVNDDDTARLMSHFYQFLLGSNIAPAEALRLAQLEMLRDPNWSSPHRWAGFVFVGDWRLTRSLGDPDLPIEKVDTGGDPEDPELRTEDDLPIPDIPGRNLDADAGGEQ